MISSITEISALISTLGVVASILYLSIQIRQNTKATRSAVHQQSANRLQERLLLVCDNDELAELISRDWSDAMTEPEKIKIAYWVSAVISDLRDIHIQCELGVMPYSVLQSRAGVVRKKMFCNELALETWHNLRDASSPDFIQWFEKHVLDAAYK